MWSCVTVVLVVGAVVVLRLLPVADIVSRFGFSQLLSVVAAALLSTCAIVLSAVFILAFRNSASIAIMFFLCSLVLVGFDALRVFVVVLERSRFANLAGTVTRFAAFAHLASALAFFAAGLSAGEYRIHRPGWTLLAGATLALTLVVLLPLNSQRLSNELVLPIGEGGRFLAVIAGIYAAGIGLHASALSTTPAQQGPVVTTIAFAVIALTREIAYHSTSFVLALAMIGGFVAATLVFGVRNLRALVLS